MRVARIVALALVLIAAGASVSAAQVVNEPAGATASDFAPAVDLWLDQISYNHGARMRPRFTTEPGAYVVIVRVTPKGDLLVMYPERPGSQKPYVLAQYPNDRVPYSHERGGLFEFGGLGFVFAIASYHRFDFSAFREGSVWSQPRHTKFGRFDDPFEAVRIFAQAILPSTAAYSLDSEVYELFSPRASGSVYQGDFGYITRDPRTR